MAEHLLSSADYLWCLFVVHLAVEKMLKATVVAVTGEHAPPTHNLLRLAGLTAVSVDDATEVLLAELTRFNIEARYPKDKTALQALCTREYTEGKLRQAQEFMSWLESKI